MTPHVKIASLEFSRGPLRRRNPVSIMRKTPVRNTSKKNRTNSLPVKLPVEIDKASPSHPARMTSNASSCPFGPVTDITYRPGFSGSREILTILSSSSAVMTRQISHDSTGIASPSHTISISEAFRTLADSAIGRSTTMRL